MKTIMRTVTNMTSLKKNIRHVFWLFVAMFFGTVAYLSYFVLVEAPTIVNSTFNPRVRIVRDNVQRGTIYDRNGEALAYSVQGDRFYPHNSAFAHVIGHATMGHSAIEERYNFYLTNVTHEFLQRAYNIAMGDIIKGDDLVLTVDAQLQNFANNALAQRRGSIVVMQPSTGDILAMVSYPTYNPNTVREDWNDIIANEHSPLLNRATQGLYPPGSTFKTLTLASAIEQDALESFSHVCYGHISAGGYSVNCFNNTAHGDIDATRAFAVSCNTFFVALAEYIGADAFSYSVGDFFAPVTFSLPMVQSQFSFNEEHGVGYLMQTAIGQGRTLLTPLYMTMLTGAVYNGGVMRYPRVVGNISSPVTDSYANIFEEETATQLQQMMVQVVATGTGTPAAMENATLAGKTGTAENDAGASHGWFTGFVVDEDIAITVMLEHSGGTSAVLPIVRDVATFAVDLDWRIE